MSKEFYDKYGKLVDCFSCNCIKPCSKSDSPLCSEGYVFFAKDKIADLEAKLAETTRKYQLIDDNYTRLSEKYDLLESGHELLLEENLKLEAKLAEKDEKIKKLKSENHALMSDNAYQEADIFELNSFKEYYKNNKISFCIEQLEKVKAVIEARLVVIEENYNEDFYDRKEYLDMSVENEDILKRIDNQIKQLKEMK